MKVSFKKSRTFYSVGPGFQLFWYVWEISLFLMKSSNSNSSGDTSFRYIAPRPTPLKSQLFFYKKVYFLETNSNFKVGSMLQKHTILIFWVRYYKYFWKLALYYSPCKQTSTVLLFLIRPFLFLHLILWLFIMYENDVLSFSYFAVL